MAGSHVRIHCDNATAVNCLNRQGSARSKPLNSWVLSILHQLKKKDIAISVFHVAGVQNVIADRLSRSGPSPSEWTLDEESFLWLCQNMGTPQVDLFATRYTARLPTFVSPVRDVTAVAVDSFTVEWNQWSTIYLFPPTNLIMRVLSVLESYRGKALLITPLWPNQNWFPVLLARAKGKVLLPRPRLFQKIGTTVTWCESSLYRTLVCWTF